MKYEMIFGDEGLFDGAPEDCILAVVAPGEDKTFYLENNKSKLRGKVLVTVDGVVKLAMRRIIRTPTWTVEDQKAGKLPEVGCEVINTDHSISLYVLCKVIYVDGEVVIVYNGELSQTYSHKAFLVAFKPIETPEERQQRVRNNWCADANKLIAADKDYRSESAIIYDALLSGELKMPEVQ